MNENTRSLVKHVLYLHDVKYTDIFTYKYYNKINVGLIQSKTPDFAICNTYYCSINASFIFESIKKAESAISDNIRSFVNHWMRYYNFNKKVSGVAIRKTRNCENDMHDIFVVSDDILYRVLSVDSRSYYTYTVYEW